MGRRGDEWQHVIPLDPPESTPKNSTRRNRCVYCNKEFVGGATRIRAHLTGQRGITTCKKVPSEVLMHFNQKEEHSGRAQVAKRERGHKARVSEASEYSVETVESCNRSREKLELDVQWAMCFYAHGIPFEVAEHPLFTKAMRSTLSFGEGYSLPTPKDMKSLTVDYEREENLKQEMAAQQVVVQQQVQQQQQLQLQQPQEEGTSESDSDDM